MIRTHQQEAEARAARRSQFRAVIMAAAVDLRPGERFVGPIPDGTRADLYLDGETDERDRITLELYQIGNNAFIRLAPVSVWRKTEGTKFALAKMLRDGTAPEILTAARALREEKRQAEAAKQDTWDRLRTAEARLSARLGFAVNPDGNGWRASQDGGFPGLTRLEAAPQDTGEPMLRLTIQATVTVEQYQALAAILGGTPS